MSSKAKSDVKVLKGQDGAHLFSVLLTNNDPSYILSRTKAENKVLDYVKRINRPYGAVDISANLKGAVPKTATQKILLALAEKGDLTQKTYGKATFFVANQGNLDALPEQKFKDLANETEALNERNKALVAEIKAASAELAQIKSTPTDSELAVQIDETESKVTKLREHLEPLRAGTPLVSTAELNALDAEWTKWRSEWVKRRKVFYNFWALASDPLSPPDAVQLAEDLGIEYDTPEHLELERGPLCAPAVHTSKRR